MERRELTKADLDKVRDIEGFPIGTDEDIIALSDAPYYTACPNPFIADFIVEHGHPYDPETDDYHREPFAADVSEGKGDPIYSTHSYLTKVPHKAIMRYILHYTKPNDIVFDGFCGTGMTAVAAQMCANPDREFKFQLDQEDSSIEWGNRNAVISDLSPSATFISANYNLQVEDPLHFKKVAYDIIQECENEYGWMYETDHIDNNDGRFSFSKHKGTINYVIWSDVYLCPGCGKEFVYWDLSVDLKKKIPNDVMTCTHCQMKFKKKDCAHVKKVYFDKALHKTISESKQAPVLINYTYEGKRFDKKPDKRDLEILQIIEEMEYPHRIPVYELPIGVNTEQPKNSHGFNYVHQFYTKRNLIVLSFIMERADDLNKKEKLALHSAVKGSLSYGTKMVKVNVSRMLNGGGLFALGAVTGTMYIPGNNAERPILDAIKNKVDTITKNSFLYPKNSHVIVSTGSLTDMKLIPSNTIDYIFTDPPFGKNLNYSELNFLWETWEKVLTNNNPEAIMNEVQEKGIEEYQSLMVKCFSECFRILKPNRWMTVEFHNSQNNVWNSIQEAIMRSGFVIADIRTLDKQQGSFKQSVTTSAVKQDLVISVYKPKDTFIKDFLLKTGTEETAWQFVQQHLEMLPVAPLRDGKIEVIAERQAFLLFDRMVAYHVQNGLPVPIDASDFYKGLEERFIQRDGMYFLSGQVNEYDLIRIKHDMEDAVQLGFIVSNEKTAVQWLYMQLAEPQTYQVLQPKFMQEVRTVDKYEKIPELAELLEENFLKNDKGEWYIPDITKAGDVAKLREKRLLKEFEDYQKTKGKLKIFRVEAVRAGFKKLWDEKNYAAIVAVADRLPESVIQEDPKLLMYFDIASTRI